VEEVREQGIGHFGRLGIFYFGVGGLAAQKTSYEKSIVKILRDVIIKKHV
jgi:hypothetical protein